MSVKPIKRIDRNRRIREIQEHCDLEADITYLEILKLELQEAKRYRKLQRRIHRKRGWKDYTC